MSGQAAVAVVISIAQLLSTILAAGSKGDIGEGQKGLAVGMGSADTSAAIFFGISTFIVVCALVAHWYLRRMPIYHEVVGSFETRTGNRLEEEAALLPAEARGVPEPEPSSPVKTLRVSTGQLKSRL
jgi:equilibrative nucleoside transporter 1/2/3